MMLFHDFILQQQQFKLSLSCQRTPSSYTNDEYLNYFKFQVVTVQVVIGMSCPSWQWHRIGYRWSSVRTLPVAPLWCDLGPSEQSWSRSR